MGNKKRIGENKAVIFIKAFFLVMVMGLIAILILMFIQKEKELSDTEASENVNSNFDIVSTEATESATVNADGSKTDASDLLTQDSSDTSDSSGTSEATNTSDSSGASDATNTSNSSGATSSSDKSNSSDATKEVGKTYTKEAVDKTQVTMLFGGDILFDDNYSAMISLKKRENKVADCFSTDLLEVMKQADIFMVNNEFPYTDRGEPTQGKTFTFRSLPENAGYLSDMGIDIVTIANNHAYDYGKTGLLDTIHTLNSYKIPFVGAGSNLDEASEPAYFKINNMTIAIIGTTQMERLANPDTKGATATEPGVFRCMEIDKLLETIKEAKEKSDFVVVYVHWGTENLPDVDWGQKLQVNKIVEAGADLIVGAHAHVLQEVDYIEGTPVAYGLGNFWFNSKAVDTGLLEVTLSNNGKVTCKFIPCRQENCKTTMLKGAEKTALLDYMDELSPNVNLDSDGIFSYP